QVGEAIRLLEAFVDTNPPYAPAYLMLSRLYIADGRIQQAAELLSNAANDPGLGQQERDTFRSMVSSLAR
ncbi:MAG: tetratricopeptide repeat protein, partial [Sedimentisphaerales bacterium]|nr:tetratricopeptide repeat protein [Sedimentisphaerales bacterium]